MRRFMARGQSRTAAGIELTRIEVSKANATLVPGPTATVGAVSGSASTRCRERGSRPAPHRAHRHRRTGRITRSARVELVSRSRHQMGCGARSNEVRDLVVRLTRGQPVRSRRTTSRIPSINGQTDSPTKRASAAPNSPDSIPPSTASLWGSRAYDRLRVRRRRSPLRVEAPK